MCVAFNSRTKFPRQLGGTRRKQEGVGMEGPGEDGQNRRVYACMNGTIICSWKLKMLAAYGTISASDDGHAFGYSCTHNKCSDR